MREVAYANNVRQYDRLAPVPPLAPQALAVAELPVEVWTRARFNRQFLGAIGVQETVEVAKVEDSDHTLAKSISLAAEGNTEAEALVDLNVATATAEGCLKDGYYRKVTKDINESGEVVQFGLTLHQLHFNSYVLRPKRSRELRAFTLAEALNGYREQDYLRSGTLKDHIMVVASCVPEGFDEAALDHRGEGFFTRSMTYCLQATTEEDGKVATESVYRRGTAAAEDDVYSVRQAKRYDLKAIGMVYEWLGQAPPKTALEFLQKPLLLKKSDFPNGVVDFLRLCDIASDVLTDQIRERSPVEYQQMIADSARKDASLSEVQAAVKQDLLATAGTFKEPEDAIRKLWDLVRVHGASSAIENREIDPWVFGPQAKERIEEARLAHDNGDYVRREALRTEVVEVATITGCGGGACGIERVEEHSAEGVEAAAMLNVQSGDTLVRDKERRCVKCGTKGTVYYVYNGMSKLNKGCLHCKATEITGKQH